MASAAAKRIASALNDDATKRSDIKKRAKEIKVDHELALELWSTRDLNPRLLAVLVFDRKRLSQDAIERLAADMLDHDEEERNLLSEWLLANQLMKHKKTTALVDAWEGHHSTVLRRLFWYRQARLRWTGQTPPPNSEDLLASLEESMGGAHPEVQWAMNFCAGWIGVHEREFRSRCVQLGERLELYRDDPVSRNCTPSYLPEFIRIEAAKRE